MVDKAILRKASVVSQTVKKQQILSLALPQPWIPDNGKFYKIPSMSFKMFSQDITEVGRVNSVKHDINTGDAAPIKQKPYMATENERLIIERSVKNMLEAGVIRPSSSPWSSPVVIVPKPRSNEPRFALITSKQPSN